MHLSWWLFDFIHLVYTCLHSQKNRGCRPPPVVSKLNVEAELFEIWVSLSSIYWFASTRSPAQAGRTLITRHSPSLCLVPLKCRRQIALVWLVGWKAMGWLVALNWRAKEAMGREL